MWAQLCCASGPDRTCTAAGGSPFQACYQPLNKSAAGSRTQSTDGQRTRERVKARGLLVAPVTAALRGWGVAGWCWGRDTISMQGPPVTQGSVHGNRPCAVQRGKRKGGEWGVKTMATHAVWVTALMKAAVVAAGRGGLSLVFKETGSPA